MFDLVISGGEVVDGTGAPRRRADVAVRDGRVVEVAPGLGPAHRVIDASGRVVTPGFVDVHTHLDAQAFWDPTLSPSPLHGVTTVVGGNCGFSIAPLEASEAGYLMRMLARVEGMPLEALEAGVPWDWSSTADYLDRLEGRLAVNAGFMVGHSAVRRAVMGEDANRRRATPAELGSMAELLRAGLRAGGLGFSSTWSSTHNDAEGSPVPSRFADAAELVALAGVCGEVEGTSLEFLPASPPMEPLADEDFGVMVEMSRRSGRPLNWNVMHVTARTMPQVEARLDVGTRAAALGARVVMLVMPQPSRTQFTFLTGFAFDAIAGWGEAMALSPDRKLALLRDPAERRRLAEAAAADRARRHLVNWERHVIVETFTPETERYRGRRVGDIARDERREPFDALLDVVVADGLRTYFRVSPREETTADWEARAAVCRDPRALIGASDAGAHLDMMATQDYTTGVLADLVRRHQVMTLEEAVHLLSEAPARLYGLRDRGTVRPGSAADLVVLDEHTVGATPWTTRTDLPGGARRLYTEALGIHHVLVNGEEIVHDGRFTDARPGRVLRSGRETGAQR